jgi:hypothetical protein
MSETLANHYFCRTAGKNLKGTRFKVLSKAYHAIATELKLTNKTEFRTKLGAVEDPIYGEFISPEVMGKMASSVSKTGSSTDALRAPHAATTIGAASESTLLPITL